MEKEERLGGRQDTPEREGVLCFLGMIESRTCLCCEEEIIEKTKPLERVIIDGAIL